MCDGVDDWKNMTQKEIHDYIETASRVYREIEAEARKKHPDWTEEQIAWYMKGVRID